MLIDYDEGELPPVRSGEVAEHLAACPTCRRELDTLRDSLSAARDVWQQAAASVEGIEIPRHRRRRLVAKCAAVAACLVLAAGAAVWVWTGMSQDRPVHCEIASTQPVRRLTVAETIRREGVSAKLAASAQILADRPGGKEYAETAFRYVAIAYPETDAGKQAKTRISSN